MKTIYKYQLEIIHSQTVILKDNSRILHLGVQDGVVCIWAEVDTEEPDKEETFLIYGTGHPMEEHFLYSTLYIGTIQIDRFVWHVYKDIKFVKATLGEKR